MNEQKNQEIQTVEISLPRLFHAVKQRAWIVALVAVVFAVATFLGTYLLITPTYEASTKLYVNNSSDSNSGSISSGDLSASRNLVDSYIVILNTPETFKDVIEYAGIYRTPNELSKMVSAEAVNSTEIFQVTVTSPDPTEAMLIADAIAHVLPERIAATIEGTSTRVVEAASLPTEPSSPSYPKNIILGFLIGFVLVVAMIVIEEIADTTIRAEEDIQQTCNYPILASIPDMMSAGKGGYHKRSHYAKGDKHGKSEPELIGNDICFSASEAYKLLRTKLQFSFAENGSHIIGVSSALNDEGKSLFSVNLAYSLSELGKKVILIDCDMRRPTLAEKLKIHKSPGFSSYLTGQAELLSLIQPSGINGNRTDLHVISAGQNPPNPNELLSSANMREAMDLLRQNYDYVLLDLPPVSEVSDAMTVASVTDGILLVVRENYCNRQSLADTVRQFEYVNAKILGVVINCATEQTGKYGKKYHKKYYHRHYSGTGRSVMSSQDATKSAGSK